MSVTISYTLLASFFTFRYSLPPSRPTLSAAAADSNLEVVGDEFNQGQAPYCVAISKECKYYDEINAAVKVLIKNGTTDELYAKWCE